MIAEATLGAALGGSLRLAPELLRYIDAIHERRHEQAMQRLELEYAVALGTSRPVEDVVTLSTADVEALREQYVLTASARSARRYPWIDATAALVRPATTGWLLALYSAVKIAEGIAGRAMWGPDDMALLSTVVGFWFMGRVWDRTKTSA